MFADNLNYVCHHLSKHNMLRNFSIPKKVHIEILQYTLYSLEKHNVLKILKMPLLLCSNMIITMGKRIIGIYERFIIIVNSLYD